MSAHDPHRLPYGRSASAELAGIYTGFTVEFESTDLKEAKALLEQLQ
jgi:hypothetical protein